MTQNECARRNLRPAVNRKRPRGFGLVELMISIVIGLIMIAALVALFLGTSRNNRQMATANSMIENGRFAIQLLESDIVHAGFWGTFVPQFDDATADGAPGDVPTGVPDPCLPYDPLTWNAAYVRNLLGVPLQAYDAADVCSGAGAPVEDMRADTDLLVVRHAATCAVGEAGCEGDVAGKLYMQSSLCPADAATFVFGRTGTAVFDLHRRHGSCEDGGPVDAGVPFAEKRRFVSNLYYVRDLVIAGVVVPTLMRSTFDQAGTDLAHQPAIPLVEGIDAFRVEIGVDSLSGSSPPELVDYTSPIDWEDADTKEMATNRGDGIPDGVFIRCTTAAPCGVDELINTTAVRLWVLARSREPTQGYTDTKEYILAGETFGPYSDGFKRHVYSTTLRLPNISGRRERP
jgi:type IV pilus assembly protein PilW